MRRKNTKFIVSRCLLSSSKCIKISFRPGPSPGPPSARMGELTSYEAPQTP